MACALLALVLAAAAAAAGVTGRLDSLLFDLETALVRSVAPVRSDQVVVVGIDQSTVDAIEKPIALWHSELGAFLAHLARGEPRLIVFDVVLPERSMDDLLPGLDRALVRGLVAARKAQPAGVVLALQPDASGRLRAIHMPFLAAAGDDAAGAAVYRVESDGAVRFFDPEISTFIAVVAVRLGAHPTPGFIDYTRGGLFEYVPLIEVIRHGQQDDGMWLTEHFGGKVVVVGSVLPLLDRRRQPVHLAAWESDYVEPPAALIHAQAIRSLLGATLIRETPWPFWALSVLAFALLALIAAPILRWLVFGAALAASFGGAAWGLRAGWTLPLSAAWVAGIWAVAARSAHDGWHFLRERNRLARMFEGYVSPLVFRSIVEGRLAGRGRGSLAVLFADVRGFTRLSETSAADDVLDWLNRYYGAVTPILHTHGATIDAFRGDGMNAMFGAPEPRADAASASLQAAREMLAALAELNAALSREGRPPLQIGIGLGFGPAVFGDVGSRDRRDFTAIGDPVNLAARLQDLTKQLDCPILMTGALYDDLSVPMKEGLVDFGVQPIRGHSAVRVWGCRHLLADGQPGPGG
jgi:class 3 adenylate cyclase/CHASE2 domain-containing sensor protein